jgi:DNA-binding CsgD family transcriptional regulator
VSLKNAAATAHIRQLCSLGLGGEVIMPALCEAMHRVIPSYAANFFWADDNGEIDNMYCEYHLPKVVQLYISEYDKFKGDLPDFAESIRSGRMTHLRAAPEGFFRSETYNQIYRPHGYHHALGGTPREAGRGLGGMVLFRRPQDPAFTDDEEREMAHLMRYVAHGLVRRSDHEEIFVDGPRSGLVIMNRAGTVIHVSSGARELLYLATHAKVGPKEMKKSKTYVAVPAVLKQLCQNLIDTFEGSTAEPPVLHHRNAWGRFTFRAYWLESVGDNVSGLIGVTVKQAEPQALRVMRNMQTLPLSNKQKEVCLLVATGHSNDTVAQRLNISVTTVRDHLRKIYDKFAVHDRKDLIAALL